MAHALRDDVYIADSLSGVRLEGLTQKAVDEGCPFVAKDFAVDLASLPELGILFEHGVTRTRNVPAELTDSRSAVCERETE